MAMQLRGIQRLNTAGLSSLLGGQLVLLGGLALSVLFRSETFGAIAIIGGFGGCGISLLLCFIIDRVKCPRCGKPFNRPEYRNWFVRQFARMNPRWSCYHCGLGDSQHAAN